MSPQRIQRKRTAGWRMPEGVVYVGRGSKWGNPFKVERRGALWTVVDVGDRCRSLREEPQIMHWKRDAAAFAVRFYELHTGPMGNYEFDDDTHDFAELAGKDLACWCPLVDEGGEPFPCHAESLLRIANS